LIYALCVGSALVLAVYALAVARITRLVTDDKIFDKPRNKILAAAPDDSKTAYFVTCAWCVSIWVAAAVAPIAYLWGTHPWSFIPALALAFSYLAGLLNRLEG
jgi:drug/metabolite transporter (DMT)-like permease